MQAMDQSKHLPPRFSSTMDDLYKYLTSQYGGSSSLSKSPSQIMALAQRQNSQSTLQIIQEEDGNSVDRSARTPISPPVQDENSLCEIRDKESSQKDRPQAFADYQDASPEETFFPSHIKVKQSNSGSSGLTILDPKIMSSQQQYQSPRFYEEGISSETAQTGFAKKGQQTLRNALQEKGLAKHLIQTYQNQPLRNQTQLSYVSSDRGLFSSGQHHKDHLDNSYLDNSRDKINLARYAPHQEQSNFPSVRSTARMNNRSLLDLMSGVSTAQVSSQQRLQTDPYSYGNSLQSAVNDQRKLIGVMSGLVANKNNTQKFKNSQYKSYSPKNYNARRNIAYSNVSKEKASMNSDLAACESTHVSSRTRRLEPIDIHNNSHGILPQSLQQTKRMVPGVYPGVLSGQSPIITIIDNKAKTQSLGPNEPCETGEQPQVIQVHSKHYHYNTNNIKIQMVPRGQSIAENSEEDSLINQQLDQIPIYAQPQPLKNKLKMNHKPLVDLLAKQSINKGQIGSPHSFVMTTMQPRKILIVNQSPTPQLRDPNAKYDTPKSIKARMPPQQQKKYFQLY